MLKKFFVFFFLFKKYVFFSNINFLIFFISDTQMDKFKSKLAKLTALLTTISSDDDEFSPHFDFPIENLDQFYELDSRITENPAEEVKLVSFFLFLKIFKRF